MGAKERVLSLLVLMLAFALFSLTVYAQPVGVNEIERGLSERRGETSGVQVQAQAGNVTALTINATRVTDRWQGYYGNITGTVTLDDAQNNTLYSWADVSPQGEIYAVNSSVVPEWDDVRCFNFTNNKSAGQNNVQRFNGTDLENSLGMNPTDVDGVDETFNRTYAGSFQIGSNTIDSSSGCSVVALYVNDAYQEVDFEEVLLTDNNSIIYTSLLEQDATGFSGSTLDFQMIVGENGDNTDPTDYYFYVELS